MSAVQPVIEDFAPAPARPLSGRWWVEHPNAVRATAVIAFFIAWEIAGRNSDPLFLAPPSRIFEAAWELTVSGDLWTAFIDTMIPFTIGMAISIVGGIIIGVAMAQWPIVEYALDPFVNALYAIPRVALVPLIMLWVGLGPASKIVILVSVAIFPVIINTFAGIRDVRHAMLEVGHAYCATKAQVFFKIVVPSAIPFLMTGIRLSVGLGIIGIIVGEFFTAQSGLGGMIVNFANLFATAKLFVPIIVVGLLGVVITEVVRLVENRLSRWRSLERQRG